MDIRFPRALCTVCGDALSAELPPMRHPEFGRVCPECVSLHIPSAAKALHIEGLFHVLTAPKNNQPRTTK